MAPEIKKRRVTVTISEAKEKPAGIFSSAPQSKRRRVDPIREIARFVLLIFLLYFSYLFFLSQGCNLPRFNRRQTTTCYSNTGRPYECEVP